MKVLICPLEHGRDLPLPVQASSGSAGFDLRAAASIVLAPGDYDAVPTGLSIALPEGWEAQVRPRSGLARRHGVTVLNSPGTVDADYRGEIQVLLVNHGKEPFTVERGDRIAQVVFARVENVVWDVVDALPSSERGAGGFGSSGVK